MNRSRYTLFTITALLVLVFSAMSAVPVLADDSVPPSTETAVESPPEDGTSTDVTEPALPEPLPEEATPTDATAPLLEETAPSVEDSVPELLASLPDGTEVVVVDETGETIPLVTQEAADAIEFIDPVWCPVGVTPKTDGSGGCTTSYGNLQDLVANLIAGTAGVVPGTNGVIWIQTGLYGSAGAIELDGTDVDLGTMENFALTLQGGWNGIHNSSLITGTSTISDSLSIINWNGDITLNNLIISGVTDGSATNSAALDIETTKKITLINVDVNGNTGAGTVHGAYLANNDGTIASDVVITNSTFSNNKNDGLTVYSDGAITITNLVANNNSNGAYLDNTDATTAKAIKISGNNNQAKFNNGDGLNVYSKGAITISNLNSSNNNGNGVYIDNSYSGNLSPQNVTITGTFTKANDNSGDGINVYSYGAIAISNLFAENNGGKGAYLDNCVDLGSGCTATLPKPITLSVSGVNTDTALNNNNGNNLEVYSLGAITLSGVGGGGSVTGFGGWVQNNFPGAVGGVTINGWGAAFGGNAGNGLTVLSKGAITINALFNFGNGGYGAQLDNSAGVNMAVTLGSGGGGVLGLGFGDNASNGLEVYSNGTITLTNISASNNGSTGAILDNSSSTSTPGITIKNTPNGNADFSWNGDDGLNVYSKGVITVMDIVSTDNGQNNIANADNGDPIDNDWGFGVWIDNTSGTGNVIFGTARKNWCNDTSRNFQSGLTIYSNGTVTLSELCAYDNGGYFNITGFDPNNNEGFGVYVDNSTATTPKAVTIKSNATTGGNAEDGLKITSKGAITINVGDMWAGNNGGNGWYLDNSVSGAVGGVTLSSSNTDWAFDFNSNDETGLVILSRGNILITGLDSYNNGGDGAYLSNVFTGSTGTITLKAGATDYNSFDNNTDNGLVVLSNRGITLSNLNVNSNGLDGAYVDNTSSGALSPQNVTLNVFGNFNGNGDTGLTILSYGVITTNNLSVYDNGQNNIENFNNSDPIDPDNGWGAYIDNCIYSISTCTALTSKAVSINGSNTFNGNFQDGLWVTSLGAITVKQVQANWNWSSGAYLDNQWSLGTGTITVTSATPIYWNWFEGNGGNGLEVYSNRAITLNNILSNSNGDTGTFVNTANHFGAYASQNVTFTGRTLFNGNGNGGVVVYADGNITIANLTANNNTGDGAYLNNSFGHGNVLITGANSVNFNTGTSNYTGNSSDGLFVDTDGNFTISNVTADGNARDGIEAYAIGNTSLSCASLINNGNFDWQLHTGPLLTLKGIVTSTGITSHITNLGNGQILPYSLTTVFISRTCP